MAHKRLAPLLLALLFPALLLLGGSTRDLPEFETWSFTFYGSSINDDDSGLCMRTTFTTGITCSAVSTNLQTTAVLLKGKPVLTSMTCGLGSVGGGREAGEHAPVGVLWRASGESLVINADLVDILTDTTSTGGQVSPVWRGHIPSPFTSGHGVYISPVFGTIVEDNDQGSTNMICTVAGYYR